MPEDDGWRLKTTIDDTAEHGALDRVLGRFRGPDVASEVGDAVSDDVVVTHDGKLLFAYAASEQALAAARGAIEGVLSRDSLKANIVVSRWDEERDEWLQTDPPLAAEQIAAARAAEQADDVVETRTMVAVAGRSIRAEFEQTMLGWAERLGLTCEIVEHPHLLSTQVAFTVTGQKHRINEFAQGLSAEGASTMRTEREVMISPL